MIYSLWSITDFVIKNYVAGLILPLFKAAILFISPGIFFNNSVDTGKNKKILFKVEVLLQVYNFATWKPLPGMILSK
jgi:hypothetical protein